MGLRAWVDGRVEKCDDGCGGYEVVMRSWGMLMEWVSVRWLAWEKRSAVEMGGWEGGRSNAREEDEGRRGM
uniref:Uncharacterized protein n=1 Tax=Physcomitrium patens TaxID=3218 RepID=A0A2K1L827_PHYPA|nr:hypothetical protein PHYPA_000610 [Physcomitrium patens]